MNPLKNKNRSAQDYLNFSNNHPKQGNLRNNKTGLLQARNIKQGNKKYNALNLNNTPINKYEDVTFSSSLSLKKETNKDLSKTKLEKNVGGCSNQGKNIKNTCNNNPEKFLVRNSLYEKQKALKLQIQKRKNLYGVVSDCKFRPDLQATLNNSVSRKQLQQPVRLIQNQKQIDWSNLGKYQQNYYKKQNYEKREYLTKIKNQDLKKKEFRQLMKQSVLKFNQKIKNIQNNDEDINKTKKRKQIVFQNISIKKEKNQIDILKPKQIQSKKQEQGLTKRDIVQSQIQRESHSSSKQSKISQQLQEISVVLRRQTDYFSVNESNLFNSSLLSPDLVQECPIPNFQNQQFSKKNKLIQQNCSMQQNNQSIQQNYQVLNPMFKKSTSINCQQKQLLIEENTKDKKEQNVNEIEQTIQQLKVSSEAQVDSLNIQNFNFYQVNHPFIQYQLTKSNIKIVETVKDKIIITELLQIKEQKIDKIQVNEVKQLENPIQSNQINTNQVEQQKLFINSHENESNKILFSGEQLIITKESQDNDDINKEFALSESNLLNVSEIISKPFQIQIEQQSASSYFEASNDEKQQFIIDDYGNVHHVGLCDILVIQELVEQESISEI